MLRLLKGDVAILYILKNHFYSDYGIYYLVNEPKIVYALARHKKLRHYIYREI